MGIILGESHASLTGFKDAPCILGVLTINEVPLVDFRMQTGTLSGWHLCIKEKNSPWHWTYVSEPAY